MVQGTQQRIAMAAARAGRCQERERREIFWEEICTVGSVLACGAASSRPAARYPAQARKGGRREPSAGLVNKEKPQNTPYAHQPRSLLVSATRSAAHRRSTASSADIEVSQIHS